MVVRSSLYWTEWALRLNAEALSAWYCKEEVRGWELIEAAHLASDLADLCAKNARATGNY